MNMPKPENQQKASAEHPQVTRLSADLKTANSPSPAVPAIPDVMAGESPAVVQESNEVFSAFMARHKKDFEMVVPKHVSPERVMRLAIAACKRTPELLKCWLPSVIGGCLESASLGLELNTPLHHAYLIPFKNNTTRRTEAEFIIGYEGYIHLMYNHPKVLSVFANSVYEADSFSYSYGSNEHLTHVESQADDKGPIIGFYAYAKLRDDAFRFVFMSVKDVDRLRDTYSAAHKKDSAKSPWTENYVAMGLKTAIRKLQKMVPKAAECARADKADFAVIDPFDPSYTANVD